MIVRNKYTWIRGYHRFSRLKWLILADPQLLLWSRYPLFAQLFFWFNQIFRVLSFLVEWFWAILYFRSSWKIQFLFGHFQLRITNLQDKCFSEISYFTIWMWKRRETPSRTSHMVKREIENQNIENFIYHLYFLLNLSWILYPK